MGAVLITGWTLFVFIFVFFVWSRSKPESIREAGPGMGDAGTGMRFALLVVVFLLLQSCLNLLFRLGELPAKLDSIYGLPVPEPFQIPALVVLFVPPPFSTPGGLMMPAFRFRRWWCCSYRLPSSGSP